MTNKSKSCIENITLKHNGKIINNPNDVCDIFNGYFTSVAHKTGNEEILYMRKKSSIIYLKSMKSMLAS